MEYNEETLLEIYIIPVTKTGLGLIKRSEALRKKYESMRPRYSRIIQLYYTKSNNKNWQLKDIRYEERFL